MRHDTEQGQQPQTKFNGVEEGRIISRTRGGSPGVQGSDLPKDDNQGSTSCDSQIDEHEGEESFRGSIRHLEICAWGEAQPPQAQPVNKKSLGPKAKRKRNGKQHTRTTPYNKRDNSRQKDMRQGHHPRGSQAHKSKDRKKKEKNFARWRTHIPPPTQTSPGGCHG